MIRKQIAAAAGTPPKNVTMVVTYDRHGTRGRRTMFRIGDDVRVSVR